MGRKGCAVFQALVNWMSDGVCVVHVCLRSQEAFYAQETTVWQNVFLMVITCINSPPWFESIHICHCDKVHLHIYTSSLHFFETLKKKNHKKNIKKKIQTCYLKQWNHRQHVMHQCAAGFVDSAAYDFAHGSFSFSVHSVCTLLFAFFSGSANILSKKNVKVKGEKLFLVQENLVLCNLTAKFFF